MRVTLHPQAHIMAADSRRGARTLRDLRRPIVRAPPTKPRLARLGRGESRRKRPPFCQPLQLGSKVLAQRGRIKHLAQESGKLSRNTNSIQGACGSADAVVRIAQFAHVIGIARPLIAPEQPDVFPKQQRCQLGLDQWAFFFDDQNCLQCSRPLSHGLRRKRRDNARRIKSNAMRLQCFGIKRQILQGLPQIPPSLARGHNAHPRRIRCSMAKWVRVGETPYRGNAQLVQDPLLLDRMPTQLRMYFRAPEGIPVQIV